LILFISVTLPGMIPPHACRRNAAVPGAAYTTRHNRIKDLLSGGVSGETAGLCKMHGRQNP
jgi:hypothetical protein